MSVFSVKILFHFCEIEFFGIAVAMGDLVHNVKAIFNTH